MGKEGNKMKTARQNRQDKTSCMGRKDKKEKKMDEERKGERNQA